MPITVKQLIERLEQYDPDDLVMIIYPDHEYGGHEIAQDVARYTNIRLATTCLTTSCSTG